MGLTFDIIQILFGCYLYNYHLVLLFGMHLEVSFAGVIYIY